MGILFFTTISRDLVGPLRLGSIFGGGFFMFIRNGMDVLVAKNTAKWQLFRASLDLVHRDL